MAISSYNELKTAIQNWAKRGDILSVVDDFIGLAEADIWQTLKIRDMEARATATAPTADRFLQLPDGFLKMRKLVLVSGSTNYELRHVAPESMQVEPAAGRPKEFTVTTQLEFDRTPDSAYTVEMQYYRSLTALSSSNQTNGVLTRFPSVYLYGSLFHFAQWAHNNDLLAKYGALFGEAIDAANKVDRRGRHGPAPAMRTEGSTP